MRFEDRVDAGKQLANKLKKFAGQNVVVFALPRGGVVLGAEIAKALKAPLDLIITRKIGHPFSSEYAICAITEDGDLICDEAERSEVGEVYIKEQLTAEMAEAKRRRQTYLGGRRPTSARDKIAIIVDDGIATGLTMRAAIRDLKKRHATKVVVAVPVSPSDTAKILREEADELVVLDIPHWYLGAVGAYYDDFEQVEDDEVISLLKITSK